MNPTIMTAIIGGVVAFWSHIQATLKWLKSLIFVTSEIEWGMKRPLLAYLWRNFWATRMGQRTFNGTEMYVKPKGRYALVAFETFGESMLFMHGLRPLFVSSPKRTQNDNDPKLRLSYLRGTFDMDQLLRAAEYQHNKENEKTAERRRYVVRKYFGKSGDDKAPIGREQFNPRHVRPLSWKREELGIPIEIAPFDALFYSPEIEEFVNHIRRWSISREWYAEHNIPWRLGALLYGLPGTGKTSFARAAAQELDMPVDVLDLVTLGNEELVIAWSMALEHSPAMVLIEDIDRVFNEDQNIKGGTLNKPGLTLDCLLNCISGAEPSDGLLVIVTANDLNKLDKALARPGRLDQMLEFTQLSIRARQKLARRILSEHPDRVDQVAEEGEGETGAQFTRRCTDLALKLHWENSEKPKELAHV